MLIAALLSAWVQYAADGAAHVRATASGACPSVSIDGTAEPMRERAGASTGFADVVCDAVLPAHAKAVRVDGRALPLPAHDPRTIVVFGDTGCRVGAVFAQACNDPAKWPLATIARSVAAAHPDLIVHVGDYLYREHACPLLANCSGSPHGDDDAAWNADWFAPAAPLFGAAPFVFARGNHEECSRNGTGWVRYLDAHPPGACADTTEPYAVDVGDLRIVAFDSATADDRTERASRVALFHAEYARARDLAAGAHEAWLVTHRPPYVNAEERAALGDALAPFAAVLAGHIHNFAAMNVEAHPPLVINGIGGASLDANYGALLAFAAGDLHVAGDVFGASQFGFGVYTRAGSGWTISLRDPAGAERARCTLADRTIRCRAEVP